MDMAVLRQDADSSTTYRVKVEHRDEELAVFSGPDALDRAIHFASTYYDCWADPTNLAQNGAQS